MILFSCSHWILKGSQSIFLPENFGFMLILGWFFNILYYYQPSNCRNKKNPYLCDPHGGEGPLNGETATAASGITPNCNDRPSILPTTQCLTGAWLPNVRN